MIMNASTEKTKPKTLNPRDTLLSVSSCLHRLKIPVTPYPGGGGSGVCVGSVFSFSTCGGAVGVGLFAGGGDDENEVISAVQIRY